MAVDEPNSYDSYDPRCIDGKVGRILRYVHPVLVCRMEDQERLQQRWESD